MITRRRLLKLRSLVPLVVMVLAGTDDVFAQAKSLRYQGKPGQQVAYEIEITVDLPDKLTTFKGLARYTVDASSESQLQLTYRGGLAESNKPKAEAGGGARGPGGMRGARGARGPRGPHDFFSKPTFAGKTQSTNRITMTARGGIAAMEGNSQLPYLLGNVSLIPFEVLPASNEQEWNYDTGISITQSKDDRRRPFGPFAQDDKTKVEAGQEVSKYSIVSQTDDLAVVKKTYQLKKPKTPNEPALTMTGEGIWTLNLRDQLPEAFDFKEKLMVEIENAQITVPITIAMRRLSAEALAKLDEDAAKARKDFEQKIADDKMKAEAPLSDAEKKEALATLKSNDATKIVNTLKVLRGKSPKDPDEEVAAAIKPLTNHANPQLREEAQAALMTWSPGFKKKHQLNEAYRGHMPVESTNLEVTAKTPLVIGQILQVQPMGAFWNAAEVLELMPDGKVKCRTRGLGAHEVIAKRNQLQLAPDEVDQPGGNPDSSGSTASRIWLDNTGKHKTEAAYLGVEGGKVKLKKTDGKEIMIPLDKLSAADRKHVEKLQKAAKDSPNPFE